jgi:hypothetical protein
MFLYRLDDRTMKRIEDELLARRAREPPASAAAPA